MTYVLFVILKNTRLETLTFFRIIQMNCINKQMQFYIYIVECF